MGKTDGLDLKLARIRAGIRQYELAVRLGIAAARLSEIEAGRRILTQEMAERIKRAINEAASGET